ncbi:YesL family protein [Paenibacillus turpanensis]|uniref:YesL family protein n=1 Tax=Paenibacillus turpanensis TaxID=2689078 RepID=UPI00140BF2C0|nr:DUF624 domain-containing protein [Paenibacillus turpanensis]
MEFRGMMGGLYRISEWIMRFSTINLLWVICSIPIFYLLVSGVMAQTTDQLISVLILMAILSPFTLFPATSAMFVVVRKWVTGNEDVPLFKTYFRGYKENYVASMLGGIIYVVLSVIMVINYRFYIGQEGTLEYLSILFVALGVVLMASLFTFFCIQVHLHMKLLHVLKNSILLTVGQPIRTIMTILTNGFILYLSFFQFTFLIPFFMGTLIAYTTFWQFNIGFTKITEKIQALEERNNEADGEDGSADASDTFTEKAASVEEKQDNAADRK